MAVSIESHTFISPTRTEGGILKHETRHHSISTYLLAFENSLELYCTVPANNTVCLNVNGQGLCLVSVCDGKPLSFPLYLLNFRNKLDEGLKLIFNNQITQVISTFNYETLVTEIEQEKNIQVKLTILEGKFTSTFSMNGKTLLKQKCDVATDDKKTCVSGADLTDIFSRLNGTENNNESETYDPDSFNDGDDVSQYKKSDDNIGDDVNDYNSNDAYKIQHYKKYANEYRGYKNVDDDADVGEDEKKYKGEIYDDCYDEELEVSASSENDSSEELSAFRFTQCQSTGTGLGTFRDRQEGKEDIETDIVDIRTHRTKLLKIMQANVLSDYFFEAELISEENMIDVNEFWNKRDIRAANSCLLNILRNRQIPKGEIKTVLEKAEEQYLLTLMFPHQSKFVSVGTQTKESSFVYEVMTEV